MPRGLYVLPEGIVEDLARSLLADQSAVGLDQIAKRLGVNLKNRFGRTTPVAGSIQNRLYSAEDLLVVRTAHGLVVQSKKEGEG